MGGKLPVGVCARSDGVACDSTRGSGRGGVRVGGAGGVLGRGGGVGAAAAYSRMSTSPNCTAAMRTVFSDGDSTGVWRRSPCRRSPTRRSRSRLRGVVTRVISASSPPSSNGNPWASDSSSAASSCVQTMSERVRVSMATASARRPVVSITLAR